MITAKHKLNQSFEDRLKFGRIAEQIVFDRIEQSGFLLYPASDGEHIIDAFINDHNKSVTGLEVKCISPFMCGGVECFGLLTRHWNEYRKFCFVTGVQLKMVVIDNKRFDYYSANFRDLDMIRTEEVNGKKVYFPMNGLSANRKDEQVMIPVKWFKKIGPLADDERQLFFD